jgi:hypothetical protein
MTEKWRKYLKLFEHTGMEVYETTGTVLVPQDEERSPDKVRVQSLLNLRELQEQQFQQLHAVYEILRMRGGEESNCR